MRSSTSSFDLPRHDIVRIVPAHRWLAMASIVLLVNALALAGWESYVRWLGYAPDYDDTPRLWAKQRARASGARREQIVLVGASRTLFDMDLDVLQAASKGPRPIQLATAGSNPMVIFTHLAQDTSYAGTTIVGVAPTLFATASGVPIENPKRYVRSYLERTPAGNWELALSLSLQAHLAFIHQKDLTLKQLIGRIPLPPRSAADAPDIPPLFARMDIDRRTRISDLAEHDSTLLRRTQQLWRQYFTPPPKPSLVSKQQWADERGRAWNAILREAKQNVAAIQQRGGRVLFLRHPSTGAVRALEDKYAPREAYWDRLVHETGAAGISYEDYPELRDFVCPEWSHLSASDSVEYTSRLVSILKVQGWL